MSLLRYEQCRYQKMSKTHSRLGFFFTAIIVLNCIFSSTFTAGCFVYSNPLVTCSSLPFIDFSRWRHRTSNVGGWIWNRGAKGKDKDKGKGKKPWFRNPETRSNWHLCYINDYMYCITGYFMRERILSMGVEFCIMFYFHL